MARKVKSYPFVEVTWDDTYDDGSWQKRKKALKHKPMFCISRGHLIKETKKYVLIAMTVCRDGDVGMVAAIPKRCIRKIKGR